MRVLSGPLPVFALAITALSPAFTQKPSAAKVGKAQRAITKFLESPGAARKEQAALRAAVKACGNLDVAVAALRTLPPLTKAKRGTRHGVEFEVSRSARGRRILVVDDVVTTGATLAAAAAALRAGGAIEVHGVVAAATPDAASALTQGEGIAERP